MVIGGGAYAPDYEGSDDYEIEPIPFAAIVYDDLIFIKGPSLDVNLVKVDGLRAGPIARYGFGRDEDDNNALGYGPIHNPRPEVPAAGGPRRAASGKTFVPESCFEARFARTSA